MTTTIGILAASCFLLVVCIGLYVRRCRVGQQSELPASSIPRHYATEHSCTSDNYQRVEGDSPSDPSADESPSLASQNASLVDDSAPEKSSHSLGSDAGPKESAAKILGPVVTAHSAPSGDGGNIVSGWDEDDLDFIETRAVERRGRGGFMPLQDGPDVRAIEEQEGNSGSAESGSQFGNVAILPTKNHSPSASLTGGAPQDTLALTESDDIDLIRVDDTTSVEYDTSVVPPNDGRDAPEESVSNHRLVDGEEPDFEAVSEGIYEQNLADDVEPNAQTDLTGQLDFYSDEEVDELVDVTNEQPDEQPGAVLELYADWEDSESLLNGADSSDQEEDSDLLDKWVDELPVTDTPDEFEPPLFDVDSDGDALSQYGKAERLALSTLQRTGLDEEAWEILLDIFMESPWSRTQRSVDELINAGTSYEALGLAAEIRRLWLAHPEFAVSTSVRTVGVERWRYSPEALSRLSWPRAAKLADAWSAYPDIAEIEHLLLVLYDRWHGSPLRQRQFHSFQLYVGYVLGGISGALEEWPEFSFDADADIGEPFDRLESPTLWPYYRDVLREHGCRPLVRKPVYTYVKHSECDGDD